MTDYFRVLFVRLSTIAIVISLFPFLPTSHAKEIPPGSCRMKIAANFYIGGEVPIGLTDVLFVAMDILPGPGVSESSNEPKSGWTLKGWVDVHPADPTDATGDDKDIILEEDDQLTWIKVRRFKIAHYSAHPQSGCGWIVKFETEEIEGRMYQFNGKVGWLRFSGQ